MKYFLKICFLFLHCKTCIYASTQGFNSPSTLINDVSVGSISWGSLSNASNSDNSYVSSTIVLGGQTNYLKATNFSFSIPSGTTIEGIEVEVEGRFNPIVVGTFSDLQIRIIKGGVIGSAGRECCNWGTSDAYQAYGGVADGWGETWSYNDINSSDFGVAISGAESFIGAGTARIDHIRIRITYSTSLPILLNSFNVSIYKDIALVTWTTKAEVNNHFFTIERSTNGVSFNAITTLQGHSNSNSDINYIYHDEFPLPEISYYRLKQTDYNGDYSYSQIIPIEFSYPEKNNLILFNNPIEDNLIIETKIESTEKGVLIIKNSNGQVITYDSFLYTNQSKNIDLSFIPSGIYILEFQTHRKSSKHKIIKL